MGCFWEDSVAGWKQRLSCHTWESQAARWCRGVQWPGPGTPYVSAVSGFQSSFSSGLETLTLVASKLILSLLCHHQGWERWGATQFWLGKSQKRLAKVDPLSGPGQSAASLDTVGAAGGGTVPRTHLFNHLSGRTFHREWQKRLKGTCVPLLSLLYWMPEEGRCKLIV